METSIGKKELKIPVPSFELPKATENILIWILMIVQLTNMIDFVIIMPFNTVLVTAFGISQHEFGLLVSSYTFSAAASAIIGIFWLDKFDRKKTLLIVYTGFIIGTLLCGVADSYMFMMIARIVAGAFGGIMSAILFSIIGDMIPEQRRGAAMGKVMSAFAIASTAGIPLGIYVADHFDWHYAFLFLAALSAINLVVGFFYLPNMTVHLKREQKFSALEVLKGIFKNSNTIYALIFMSLVMMAGFLLIPFIAAFIQFNEGFSFHDLEYMYLAGGIASFFTSRYIGMLSDKYGKAKVFQFVAFLSVLPIIALTNLPQSSMFFVLLVTTLMFIFFGGRGVPAFALVTSTVPPMYRGRFMSVSSAFQMGASGCASLIAGVMVTQTPDKHLVHFNNVGWLASAITIICVILVVKVKPYEQTIIPS